LQEKHFCASAFNLPTFVGHAAVARAAAAAAAAALVVCKQCVHGSPINDAIYELATRAGNRRPRYVTNLTTSRQTHTSAGRCLMDDRRATIAAAAAAAAPFRTMRAMYAVVRRTLP